jgi:hypothetical protein
MRYRLVCCWKLRCWRVLPQETSVPFRGNARGLLMGTDYLPVGNKAVLYYLLISDYMSD